MALAQIYPDIQQDETQEQERKASYQFYRVKLDGDGMLKDFTIEKTRWLEMLAYLGLVRYDLKGASHIVLLRDNQAKLLRDPEIGAPDIVEDHLYQWGDWVPELETQRFDLRWKQVMVLDKIYNSISTLFAPKLLYRLRPNEPLQFIEDERHLSFFFYENGFVSVSAAGSKLEPYTSLKKTIWATQKLSRDFKPVAEKVFLEHHFAQFVMNLANNYTALGSTIVRANQRKKDTDYTRNDPKRFGDFCRIIGYNLHRFFDMKLKATLLTDARMSLQADGRTGKTMIVKFISKMLNTPEEGAVFTELNGKDFDFTDKFRYQECDITTRVVCINDVDPKKLGGGIEPLFNDITEGIRYQRKNEAPIPIMAKIIITTNRTLKVEGGSAKDRILEFELADYYRDGFSPADEFGLWFGRDWVEHDWNCFDNFMLYCVQQFLNQGLPTPGAINLLKRKQTELTCKEFVEWMDEQDFTHLNEYEKSHLKNEFVRDNDDHAKITTKKFSQWVEYYATYGDKYAKVESLRTGGKSFYVFSHANPPASVVDDSEEFFENLAAKEAGKMPF
jgi:hypothetical protein